MSRSSLAARVAAVLVLAVSFACGYSTTRSPSTGVAPTAPTVSTADRMLVRTGAQTVTVDSPAAIGRRVERMVLNAGGYLERSRGRSDHDVEVVGRVPAQHLSPIMDSVAAMGIERNRMVTGSDVTDQYADLDARLRSTIALRDRIQQLLARATTLEEVLTLERQIARLQTEIDALQSRLDQLQSRADMASLAVTLEQERTLGPLSLAGRGLVRFVGKLF